MFKHRGKRRTLTHNLKLASLLSFVAGVVNASGLFAVQKLTTNVTGHFAFFAEEMTRENFDQSVLYLLFILAFLSGAFCSNLLVEIISKVNERFINSIPVGIEISILAFIALMDPATVNAWENMVACMLLFSMGLQNALVTSLSSSIVRTTHLTGLFTDLGIEISQLFFYKKEDQQKKLKSSIKLRLTIIFFFFAGCITGGYGYLLIGLKILLLAVAILVFALFYDSVKFQIVSIKRQFR